MALAKVVNITCFECSEPPTLSFMDGKLYEFDWNSEYDTDKGWPVLSIPFCRTHGEGLRERTVIPCIVAQIPL